MKKPFFLGGSFFPPHNANKMSHEGNVENARNIYFSQKPPNLHFLLRQRYEWMNPFLEGKKSVFELGCGAGFSKAFITHPNFVLTDVRNDAWVEKNVDALNMPFADGSVGALVASHMIHHVATPHLFFTEAIRVLEPGGLLVIHEINTSLLMRLVLRLMRHEGYSYDVDVFSPDTVANRPEDPWSANCAIPQMLFNSPTQFERHFPALKIIHNELCECYIFLLSGGVIAKTKTVSLPHPLLQLIHKLDQLLIKLMPSIFALGRQVVIQKL